MQRSSPLRAGAIPPSNQVQAGGGPTSVAVPFAPGRFLLRCWMRLRARRCNVAVPFAPGRFLLQKKFNRKKSGNRRLYVAVPFAPGRFLLH